MNASCELINQWCAFPGQGRILHGNESPVGGPLAEGLLCCLQSAALPVQTPSAGESADAACSV